MRGYSILVVLILAAASGCQTQQLAEMNYSEQKILAEQIVKRCVAQGVKLGTQEMRLCTQVEIQREDATRKNNLVRAQRAQASMAAGLQNASNSYNRAAAQTAARNRSVTCTRVPSPAGYSSVRCY